MKALVIDNGNLHRCGGDIEAVFVRYSWGYTVLDSSGRHEFCHDLGGLLAGGDVNEDRLKAIRYWLEDPRSHRSP